SIVVEDHHAAGREPRPHAFENVLRRAVDVDVAMAEPEGLIRDPAAGVLGEDPLEELDVVEFHRRDQALDDLPRSVVVLAVAVVRVHGAALHDSSPGVAEVNRIFETEPGGPRGHERSCPASPDADLENRALDLTELPDDAPQLVAAPDVDERVATNGLVD